MAPNTLDPEEALDLLGLEDDDADKGPDGDVLEVEFPPITAPRAGAQPSAAASRAAAELVELRKELAAEKKAREKAEGERDKAEKLARRLQEEVSKKPAADGARELDAARKQIATLKAQVEALQTGALADDGEAPAPKEGSLESYPYAKLLVRLMRQKFSGRVQLKTGNARREVYYDAGAPAAFSSSEPGERLGRVLVTQAIISEEQYLEAARAMVERGAKLTEALLEMGAITADRLQQEQRQLTRDQIISGFGLTQGTFTIEENKVPPDEVTTFDFSLGEIFVQGYRRYAPEADVHAVFDSLKDNYVRARKEMAALHSQLGLDQDDERILKLLGEAYTLAEATERAGIAEDRGARLVGALKTLGLVESWQPGVSEFEARLKAEKLRTAEETLALKQKLQEREETLFVEISTALRRIEAALAGGSIAVAGQVVVPQAAAPGGMEMPAPQAEDPGAALGQLPEGGELDSGEDGPGHERYKEGMRQAAAGRLDEAESALREAVRLDATKPAYLTALARVLLANPRYERSGTLPVVRSLLDRAQALAPGEAEVGALLQRIQQEMA